MAPEPTGPEAEPPAEDDEPLPTPTAPGRARVLTFDGLARKFAVYDAAGAVVHDLWPRLEIDGPTASVAVAWADTTTRADNAITSTRLRIRAAGLPDALPTRLIVAAELPGGRTRVALWALDGEVIAEVELAERWEHFALSPTGAHLFVERALEPESSSLLDAALIRIADGQVLWQGAHETSAFARDDGHFVFTPGREDPVGVIDLATGEESSSTHPDLYKYEQAVGLGVEACSSAGVVLRTYGWITDGQPLWALGWDGQLRAFDPTLPRLAEEIFFEFGRDGASALWQRTAKQAVNGLPPIDEALLGFFELDLATGDNRAVASPDYECPAGRVHRFEVRNEELAACDCAAGRCAVVARLPALAERWVRNTTVSPDGGFVLVNHGWPGNALPMNDPDSLLFDAGGAQLSVLPNGYGGFDHFSRLLLFQTSVGTRRIAIVDLVTARVTWLERPYASAIVYE